MPPDIRGRMMTGIQGQNTRPGMVIRLALYHGGLRFRPCCHDLSGKTASCF
ncbi:MAG: hypothetical protein F4X92_01170 [Gammaproteobacteria bacterium]|nr:hypothetical protein [Gammaproteobacteria bacterium]